MSLTELLIVYFACGAPFGVYFYFQQRESGKPLQNTSQVWLKCTFIVVFWLPFAFWLIFSKFSGKQISTNHSGNSNKDSVSKFEGLFLKVIFDNKLDINAFDFREIFERYVGLTKELAKPDSANNLK